MSTSTYTIFILLMSYSSLSLQVVTEYPGDRAGAETLDNERYCLEKLIWEHWHQADGGDVGIS